MAEQKDILKKLRKYVSHLDQMIKIEEDSLSRLPKPENSEDYFALHIREPIARTIVAYEFARRELLELLPELRGKAKSQPSHQ